MLYPGVKKLGKELGFKRTNNEAVGMMRNCFVKLYDGRNMKLLEIFVPQIFDADKEQIEEILKQDKVKRYEWFNNSIKITFPEYFRPYSMSKIKNILISITDHFYRKYPEEIPQCHDCGEQKRAEAYYIGNVTKFLCSDCFRTAERTTNEKFNEYQQEPNNYFRGFIGALLFAIPGILVTILLFIFLERLAAISALLYIVLGMKGYKLFKGKTTPLGALIVILTGILMIAVGIIITYSVFIMKEIKTTDLNLVILILKVPEIRRDIILNIGLSYVISAFFIIVQLIQMMKEWRFLKNIQKAGEIK